MQSELIKNAIYRLDENTAKLNKCLAELSEEELWKRPNASLNSVANLILHLCGNMTQYVIASIGGKPDLRERDIEFAVRSGMSRAEITEKLHATLDEVKGVLQRVDESELLRIRSVQGYRFSGVGNVLHIVEHYSYHTGQIIFWTKLLRNKDLHLYGNVDLNARNEP